MTDHNGLYAIGGGAVGLLSVFLAYIRVKKAVKEELVEPEVNSMKKEIASMKTDIALLKNNDKELSSKVDHQFESVKFTLSETNQNIAKMQGTLDLLIKQLTK